MSTLTFRPNFCPWLQSPELIVLCNFHLKLEFILASLPQPNLLYAELTQSLWPSVSDILTLYTNITNLEFFPFVFPSVSHVFKANLNWT